MYQGERRRNYPLLRQRNLVRDFVQLGTHPTRLGVLSFASRYGWLGQPRVLRGREPGPVLRGESYRQWCEQSRIVAAL